MDPVDIATALFRGLHLMASLSLFGALLFRLLVLPRDASRGDVPLVGLNRVVWVSAWLAVIFGAAWLTAVSGTMAGADSAKALFNVVLTVAEHTSFGNFLCARLLLLVAVLPLLLFDRFWAGTTALVAAGAGLALQPLLGHIGASDVAVLIPVEAAHLLAAGAWLGGLLPLLLCVSRTRARLAVRLCERFTTVGLVAVGSIAVTALPQGAEMIGGVSGLFGTQYGRFALIKIGLFIVALCLACVNRLVLTRRLDDREDSSARRWLIRSVSIETLAVCGIVLAAGFMASSPPAAHTQPVWPFSWRPSLVAWGEPELRGELIRLFAAAAVSLSVVCISLVFRRFRVAALGVAIIIFVPIAPSLSLLAVEAYPTSYMRSPTGFSVDAIARGEALFGQDCAVCHNAQAGTGGAADLTAPHLWEHLDGELFWFVTNGIASPEGEARMPAFGEALPEDDRWALIDYIRAHNWGIQAADTGHWSPGAPAPATPLSCSDSQVDSLSGLSDRILNVIADGEEAEPGSGDLRGAVTIRLPRGSPEQPAKGECVAIAETAWGAWRVVSGIPPDRFGGYRAIVDGQGWLRAWLPPDAGEEKVAAAIRDARDHPLAAGARPAGGHHH